MPQTPEQLFINQHLRTLSKTVRILRQQIEEAVDVYDALTIPDTSAVMDDTRGDEGLEDATGADVNAATTLLVALRASINGDAAGLNAMEKLYPFRLR